VTAPVLTEADLDRIEAHARTPAWKVSHSETRQNVRDLVVALRECRRVLEQMRMRPDEGLAPSSSEIDAALGRTK